MTKIWENLLINIKKEKLLSLSNIFVMTVTFLILGIFIYILIYSQTALHFLENQAQITIFFKDDYPEAQILELQNKLKNDERISDVKYVSKQEAFKIFSDINKDEPVLLESISANILPASLEVKAKSISKLTDLSNEYSSMDGVEEVKYFKDVVEKFRRWTSIIYGAGIVLLVVFFLISYSVIISTLRTTINSKGSELEILKLVGASDHYVKNPLILQGISFGGISSFGAGLFLTLISIVSHVAGIFPSGLSIGPLTINYLLFSIIVLLILLLSGIGLGFVGSLTAVKKYLKY